MLRNHAFGIHGHVSRGFEAAREVFTENFVRRGELSGACCAFVRGERVLDCSSGEETALGSVSVIRILQQLSRQTSQ